MFSCPFERLVWLNPTCLGLCPSVPLSFCPSAHGQAPEPQLLLQGAQLLEQLPGEKVVSIHLELFIELHWAQQNLVSKWLAKLFSEGRRNNICSDVLSPLQIFFLYSQILNVLQLCFKSLQRLSLAILIAVCGPLQFKFCFTQKTVTLAFVSIWVFLVAQRSTLLTRPAGLVLLFLE